MHTKIVRLPPKKIIAKYNEEVTSEGYPPYPKGQILRGFVSKDDGTVYLEMGATKTREFHEVWHSLHPHDKDLSPQNLVDNEIKAELYAWGKMGRKPNVRVGIPATSALLVNYPEKYSPDNASGLVVRRLRHFGVEASPEGRRFLCKRFGCQRVLNA